MTCNFLGTARPWSKDGSDIDVVTSTAAGALVAPLLVIDPAVAGLAHSCVFAPMPGADVLAVDAFGAPVILDVVPSDLPFDEELVDRLRDRAAITTALGGRHGIVRAGETPFFTMCAGRAAALVEAAMTARGRPEDSEAAVRAVSEAGGQASVRMVAARTGLGPQAVWRALASAAMRGEVLVDPTRNLDGESLVVSLGGSLVWTNAAWVRWSVLALLAPEAAFGDRLARELLAGGLAVPVAAVASRSATRPATPPRGGRATRASGSAHGSHPVVDAILAAAAERLADKARSLTLGEAARWAVEELDRAAHRQGRKLPVPSYATILRRLRARRSRRE